MASQEEAEKEKEINENTAIGELTIDQFRKLLMESVAEAFENFPPKNQSKHSTLEKDEKTLGNEQRTEEEQNYDQEEMICELKIEVQEYGGIKALTKIEI
ncbi:UNVERIFIED_CONTAM: hypothetical protein K2H54_074334 [Gekko kuhli]